MTEVINVSKKDFEAKIQEKLVEGFDIVSKVDNQCILEKKAYGNIVLHIVLAIFTFWLIFIPNLIYLAYSYTQKSKKVIITKK